MLDKQSSSDDEPIELDLITSEQEVGDEEGDVINGVSVSSGAGGGPLPLGGAIAMVDDINDLDINAPVALAHSPGAAAALLWKSNKNLACPPPREPKFKEDRDKIRLDFNKNHMEETDMAMKHRKDRLDRPSEDEKHQKKADEFLKEALRKPENWKWKEKNDKKK